MRILVDALSATSMSGRHVLLGHLEQLSGFAGGRHDFFVLFHQSNSGLRRVASPNINWIAVPDSVRDWKRRLAWQMHSFGKLIRECAADVVFTPAGTVFPGCPIPQVSLASNPWCLMSSVHRGISERMKALLQRRAYRYAVANAALMAYTSAFMRDAYRRNAAGTEARESVVAYPGLDDDTHAVAAQMRGQAEKASCRILAVSAMAPWKNIETLIATVKILRDRKLPVSLQLVGPWSDAHYERVIRSQIAESGLAQYVSITGGVSRDELYRQYAEATVFCLLSRCESFGIPALEAQLFGTPAVVSEGCAMPEICGPGAIAVQPDDALQAADSLTELLENSARRKEMAQAAIDNASAFRWSQCSLPLQRIFDLPVGRLS